MKTNNTAALGTAPVGPLLLKLSVPAMAGMFMMSLYNVVDAFFVGRGVGALGIASVFVSFPATLVIMAVSQTFGVGGASVIARALGAERHDEASAALGTIMTSGLFCALAMTAALMIFTRPLLTMLGATHEIIESSLVYAGIIFLGTPAFFMMMVFNNLVRGEGNTGLNGGPSGDLMVTVSVRSHPLFTRQGQDVYCEMPITFTQAACGAEVEVPTLDGKVRYTIGEGTQTGTTFRLKGKGIPYVNGRSRGDQYVTVVVETPTRLTREQKELLRKFEEATSESAQPKRKKFFEKLRDAFDK